MVLGGEGEWRVRCPNCYNADGESGASEAGATSETAATIFDNLFETPETVQPPGNRVESSKPTRASSSMDPVGDSDSSALNTAFENIADVDTRHPDDIPVDLSKHQKIAPASDAPKPNVPRPAPPAAKKPKSPSAPKTSPPGAGQAPARPDSPTRGASTPPSPGSPPAQPVPELEDLSLDDLPGKGNLGTISLPDDELAPLSIDGISNNGVNFDGLYGIKCQVCDTRIHVTDEQLGKSIECPICYTKVKVTPRTRPRNEKSFIDPNASGDSNDSNAASGSTGGDLTLEAPVQRSPTRTILDPDVGLPSVEQDMLSPMQPAEEPGSEPAGPADGRAQATPATGSKRRQQFEQQVPELEVVDDSPVPNRSEQTTTGSEPPGMSRRKRFEEKQNFEAGEHDNDPSTPAIEIHTPEDLEPKSIGELLSRAVRVLMDPGLIWRAVVATILIALGAMTLSFFHGLDKTEKGFVAAFITAISGLLYWALGGAGTVFLWYICGYVFRATARGADSVKHWKYRGFDEIKSIFLLFSFSFFIVWIPLAMIWPWVSAPIQMLLAPFLLLGAWYNQSPFNVLCMDAFKNAGEESGEWMKFMLCILGIAVLTAVACALCWIEFMNPVFSIVGATILVVMTIAFAAITGGHVGRVVARLK